jgi:hypothetical protein
MRSSVVHLVRTCEQLALQFATTSAIQVDKAEIGIMTGSATDPFTPVAFGKSNTPNGKWIVVFGDLCKKQASNV